MRCPHCDADTPDGAKFCIECGTPLTPRCPQCGADTLPRAKFCGACGTPLTTQTSAQHALRGEVWEKALAYGRQAGGQSSGTLSLLRGRGVL